MKPLLLPLAAALAIVVALAPNAPASAAETIAVPGPQVPPQDISAARRKHTRYHYRHHTVRYWAPPIDGLRAGDPTARPNSLYNYYRRNNICAIDEGYGRATRCD